MTNDISLSESALRTIDIELAAASDLRERVGTEFESACRTILNSSGRVVVLGMGKSGHIGKKIAATLASTGTPALFVHPAEASHGDFGMITEIDVVLAISNSGNTAEITSLLPLLKRKKIPVIAMTGNRESALAEAAEHILDVSVREEACPLGLAPTSSTTATLILGDALAMALLEARGFTRDDFASSHPGGSLGRRLLVKVEDVMHSGTDIPLVRPGTRVAEALIEMGRKGFGLTTVCDEQDAVLGVFTDGDLRRTLDGGKDISTVNVEDVMSREFKYIKAKALAAEAASLMQESNVYALLIVDSENRIEGIVKMHDLLQANVV